MISSEIKYNLIIRKSTEIVGNLNENAANDFKKNLVKNCFLLCVFQVCPGQPPSLTIFGISYIFFLIDDVPSGWIKSDKDSSLGLGQLSYHSGEVFKIKNTKAERIFDRTDKLCIHAFFYKYCNIFSQAQMLLSKSKIF